MSELLTGSSELAIRALVQIGLRGGDELVTPGDLAAALDCSSSYLAKILTNLSRAGYLRSQRGPQGGVQLAVPPGDISLRDVMETVQGVILPSYCRTCELSRLEDVCAYHLAMSELYEAATAVLGKWTIADLVARPTPRGRAKSWPNCRMRATGEPASDSSGKAKKE